MSHFALSDAQLAALQAAIPAVHSAAEIVIDALDGLPSNRQAIVIADALASHALTYLAAAGIGSGDQVTKAIWLRFCADLYDNEEPSLLLGNVLARR